MIGFRVFKVMAKDLNRAQLIGRLTRDPELRYTPNGSGVCSFGIATNRTWTTDTGEKREEVDFHNIVAWNKLAEICSQYLAKGRRVYVEGRLTTRSWTGQDGAQKTRTEIVLNDMIMLDAKGTGVSPASAGDVESASAGATAGRQKTQKSVGAKKHEEPEVKDSADSPVPAGPLRPPSDEAGSEASNTDEEVSPDDIPF